MPPKSAKPSIEKVQTLHPVPGKVNKKIAADKYELVKKNLLAILAKEEPTHLELMEALYQRIGKTFEGGVQWYGEIVKLDLEARKIIGRTRTKPERYTLTM
ncbi:MAG: hypothetical protein WBP58_14420 [Chitinophagaceae bacterium]